MKKKDILTALLLLGSTVQAQNWPEIKPEARPGSRWWWMGSAVDQKGLAYNLHKYGTAGIGSLEITPIYGVKGNEQRDIPFLSSRWMEMYQYTQDEAHRHRYEYRNGMAIRRTGNHIGTRGYPSYIRAIYCNGG